MNIKFEKTAYFYSLEDKITDTDMHFSKTTLKYQQEEDVTIKEFSIKYSSDGWVLRKIFFIPLAIGGVIKTILHLFQAVIWGLPSAFFSDNSYLKSRLFYLLRDFQEVMGRLISLFNDMKGQFHIQESQFHKTCYDIALKNINLSSKEDPDSIFYEEESNNDLKDKISINGEKLLTISELTDTLYMKMASVFFDKKEYDKSLENVVKIKKYSQKKENLIIHLARHYHVQNDSKRVHQALREIVVPAFLDSIRQDHRFSIDCRINKKLLDNLLNNLTKKSYNNAKLLFDNKSESEDILNNIKQTVSDQDTANAFFEL